MAKNLMKRILTRVERVSVSAMDFLNISSKDISWKIRSRMKNDRNPLFITLQDKFKVKDYARERGVETAETYYVTDDPDTIPFDTLPILFSLKQTMVAGGILHA